MNINLIIIDAPNVAPTAFESKRLYDLGGLYGLLS